VLTGHADLDIHRSKPNPQAPACAGMRRLACSARAGCRCSLRPLREQRKAASPFRLSRLAVLRCFRSTLLPGWLPEFHGPADIPEQRLALLQHAVETTRLGPTAAMISRPGTIRTSARHPHAPVVFKEDSLARRNGSSKAESCPRPSGRCSCRFWSRQACRVKRFFFYWDWLYFCRLD
jgi:hypothetical protein